MIVGFMRNFKDPTYMAKLTAMLCQYENIDIIYLRPRDVDTENKTVKGKMYINHAWTTVETDLPVFIDISPYCFKRKNRIVMNYLQENTLLSDNRKNTFSKEKLQRLLKKDGEFSHVVIPTERIKSQQGVDNFLEKYATIVLKPIGGERGKGVYILRQKSNRYILGYQKEESQISPDEFATFFRDYIQDKKYIMQKYVSSRSVQGDPFDCRIHVEKNGEGKWISARNYIRIGIGQKVISNISQGGGVSNPEPFLKANFGDEWESINKKINKLAITLPYKYEEFRGTKVMSLGMDIGIDEDGKLYLFEINGAPLTAPLRSEAVFLRTQYYKYIIKDKLSNSNLNKSLNKTNFLKSDNESSSVEEQLIKEREYFKKKIEDMKNSKSWKVTKPLRKITSMVKGK